MLKAQLSTGLAVDVFDAGTGMCGGGTASDGPEPTWSVVLRLGRQVTGAGRWEGAPGRLRRTLTLRAVFAEAVSCCNHICV